MPRFFGYCADGLHLIHFVCTSLQDKHKVRHGVRVKRNCSADVQYIEIFNDSWDVEVKSFTDNQVHVDIKGKQKDKKKIRCDKSHRNN